MHNLFTFQGASSAQHSVIFVLATAALQSCVVCRDCCRPTLVCFVSCQLLKNEGACYLSVLQKLIQLKLVT